MTKYKLLPILLLSMTSTPSFSMKEDSENHLIALKKKIRKDINTLGEILILGKNTKENAQKNLESLRKFLEEANGAAQLEEKIKFFKKHVTSIKDVENVDQNLLQYISKVLGYKFHPDDKEESLREISTKLFKMFTAWQETVFGNTISASPTKSNQTPTVERTDWRSFGQDVAKVEKIVFRNKNKLIYEVSNPKEIDFMERKSTTIWKLWDNRDTKKHEILIEIKLKCSDDAFNNIIAYLRATKENEEENLLLTFLGKNDITYFVELIAMYEYFAIITGKNSEDLWNEMYEKVVTSEDFTPNFAESNATMKDNSEVTSKFIKKLFSELIKYFLQDEIEDIEKKLSQDYATIDALMKIIPQDSREKGIFETLKNSDFLKDKIESLQKGSPFTFIFKWKKSGYIGYESRRVEGIKKIEIPVSEWDDLKRISNFAKNERKKSVTFSELAIENFMLVYECLLNYLKDANNFADSFNKELKKIFNDSMMHEISKINTLIDIVIAYNIFQVSDQQLDIFFETKKKEIYDYIIASYLFTPIAIQNFPNISFIEEGLFQVLKTKLNNTLPTKYITFRSLLDDKSLFTSQSSKKYGENIYQKLKKKFDVNQPPLHQTPSKNTPKSSRPDLQSSPKPNYDTNQPSFFSKIGNFISNNIKTIGVGLAIAGATALAAYKYYIQKRRSVTPEE